MKVHSRSAYCLPREECWRVAEEEGPFYFRDVAVVNIWERRSVAFLLFFLGAQKAPFYSFLYRSPLPLDWYLRIASPSTGWDGGCPLWNWRIVFLSILRGLISTPLRRRRRRRTYLRWRGVMVEVVVLVPGKVVVLLLYNVILIMLYTVKWPNPCLESPVPSKTMVQV